MIDNNLKDTGHQQDDDYTRFSYIRKKLFTVSNLDTPVSNPKQEEEGKTLTLITCMGIFWILLYITQSANIKKLLPIEERWIFFFYCCVSIGVTAWAAMSFSASLRNKVKSRNEKQDGNSQFSLSDVWNITPAGITELNYDNTETVSVKYDTQAFILRGIMTGIVDLPDNQDSIHYQTMAKFVDIIVREGYELSRVVLPYNTNNDPIWDNESQKIAKAYQNGTAYTMFRTSLMNCCLEFTEMNSKVNVSYYIIKAGYSTKSDLPTLIHELMKLNGVGCMHFDGVSIKEFKNLLEDYYGVSVSLEDISNFMRSSVTDMGECKLISYEDFEGNLIKFSKYANYNLPRIFSTISDLSSLKLDEDSLYGDTDEDTNLAYNTESNSIFAGEIVD